MPPAPTGPATPQGTTGPQASSPVGPAPGHPAGQPAGERVIAEFGPSILSVPVRAARAMLVGGILIALAIAAVPPLTGLQPAYRAELDLASRWMVWLGAAIIFARLAWEIAVRACRRYTLTSDRLISRRGVFNTTSVEIPLARVQQAVLDRTLLERIAGIGTLAVTSAGSQMIDLAWVMIDRPGERLAQLRDAMGQADRGRDVRLVSDRGVRLVADAAPPQRVGHGLLVVGLVGGIGAGKSEVARAFGERGWLVIDSDKDAKAALDQPLVRQRLIEWWGPSVIGRGGLVDRRAVAEIVFNSPAERRRLESLVHPLVKSHRGAVIAKAAAEGRAGVVIDAPLLLEAGSDAECDAVVFVDAPRQLRLDRVAATRGWSPAELERREKAQIPLEDKRRRADEVIVNDAATDALRARVRDLIQRLAQRAGRGRSDPAGIPTT